MDKWVDLFLEYVKKQRGNDFSGYHYAMLLRRIDYRKGMLNKASYQDYYEHLINEPYELDCLLDSLTINVSRFFRNPLMFELLMNQVFPELNLEMQYRRENNIRIWSAGCANGEEAFSLAMILLELIRKEWFILESSIFATDIDLKALQAARTGVFPYESLKEVKLEYFNKYFIPEGGLFRLHPDILGSVSLTMHDLLDDRTFAPPDSIFGNFHIILCRNVLIYYRPEYQERIFAKLHKALIPGGYLILGEAEMLPEKYLMKYTTINRTAKIFKKIAAGN